MYSPKILEKYAKLIVKTGANVQKGQPVIVRGAIEAKDLIEEIVKQAYEAGALTVRVDWNDAKITRMNYDYQSLEFLADIPDWSVERERWYINRGCCMIHVSTVDPDAMVGVDTEKLRASQVAVMKKMPELMTYSMNNVGQWTIAAYPNLTWAKKVFPNDSDKVAIKKLGNAILKCVRVSSSNDPVRAWKIHNNKIRRNCRKLNSLNLAELHYTNSLGTDLVIKLPEGHLWEGGCEKTSDGRKIVFNPNMPTEEVFSLPHKDGVDGRVYATKPLVYNGNIIDKFWLEFKDGKVVKYDAEVGKEYLKALLSMDEGSTHLGEVALVPFDSPINNSGILFFSTLFDENASCHLALGRAYPTCVKGGDKMSQEELTKRGVNNSFVHVDFMVGSSDLDIIGTTKDGKKVQIFKKGNFAF